jgi:group I intron endonuclease
MTPETHTLLLSDSFDMPRRIQDCGPVFEVVHTKTTSKPYGIIYLAWNTTTGMGYVGQTKSTLSRRITSHRGFFKASKATCRAFKAAVDEHGWDAFVWAELATAGDPIELNHLEKHYIALIGTLSPLGYNLTTGGTKGAAWAAETSAKLSEAQAARWKDPEYRRSQSESAKKQFEDPENRRKSSEAAKAQWSDEFRFMMSKTAKVRCADPDYKRAMSESAKAQFEDPENRRKSSEAAKAQWEDPDYRRQMSESAKTRWEDPDYRRSQVGARKGKTQSEETKGKRSASLRAWWAKKKGSK